MTQTAVEQLCVSSSFRSFPADLGTKPPAAGASPPPPPRGASPPPPGALTPTTLALASASSLDSLAAAGGALTITGTDAASEAGGGASTTASAGPPWLQRQAGPAIDVAYHAALEGLLGAVAELLPRLVPNLTLKSRQDVLPLLVVGSGAGEGEGAERAAGRVRILGVLKVKEQCMTCWVA